MAQSISQIRSEIEHTKEHISQTVGELEDRFQDMKDFKKLVNQYPLPMVGIAFGLGFLLSGALQAKTVLRYGQHYGGQVLAGTLTGILTRQLQGVYR